jgi:hypothetical protein
MKSIATLTLGLVLTCGVIYGFYWIAKTVSYTIFYEDMVQDTVKEMVKPEYLNSGV